MTRLVFAWLCFGVGLLGAVLVGWHTQQLYACSVVWLVCWSMFGLLMSVGGKNAVPTEGV